MLDDEKRHLDACEEAEAEEQSDGPADANYKETKAAFVRRAKLC